MRMKNLQYAGIDNVFVSEKSCRKMYTIFSAVQRQQRKSDVMTSFGLTACSAVYYHAGSSLAAPAAPRRFEGRTSRVFCRVVLEYGCQLVLGVTLHIH
jgi:hypothetical protein